MPRRAIVLKGLQLAYLRSPPFDIIDAPCRAKLDQLARLFAVSSGFAGHPRRRLRIRPRVNKLGHRGEQYQADSCHPCLCRTPWSQLRSMRGWQVDRVGLGTARTTPPACWHSDQPSRGRPPTASDSSFHPAHMVIRRRGDRTDGHHGRPASGSKWTLRNTVHEEGDNDAPLLITR